MGDYTKESVSDLLFQKIDAIIIVDAQKDYYKTVKKKGLFENLLDDEGPYQKLVEMLWFHLNDDSSKITDDYHVFVPMIGKFKGKYVDKIKLKYQEKIHLIQISAL